MKIKNLKAEKCRSKKNAEKITRDHTFIPTINANSSMIAEKMGRRSKADQ